MNVHPSLLNSPSLFSVFLLLLCVSSSLSSFPSSLSLSSTYSFRLSNGLFCWRAELGGWRGSWPVSVKSGYVIVFNKMNIFSVSFTYSLLPTTTSHAWKLPNLLLLSWGLKASIAFGWNLSLDKCGRLLILREKGKMEWSHSIIEEPSFLFFPLIVD